MHNAGNSRRDALDDSLIKAMASTVLGRSVAEVPDWKAQVLKGGWGADAGVVARVSGEAVLALR